MDKNLQFNVYNYGFGKSLYNVDGSTAVSNQSEQTLSAFINGIQASSGSAITSNESNSFGVLEVTQELDFANGRLKILYNQNPYIAGVISEQSDYVIFASNSQTELLFRVPYLYPQPDYVPTNNEAPEKWYKIIDSKFQITGPFAFLNTQKTAFLDNIITLNYYDRVAANAEPSTILVNDTNDRGIDFEYINGSNIQRGFMGYNKSSNRWVFWSNAEYTGPNIQATDNPEITIARTIGNINNFDLDIIYTNNIISADRTGLNTLAISSVGTLDISTSGSSNEVIAIGGNISETATNFYGTYVTEGRLIAPTVNIGYGTNLVTTYNLNSVTANLSSSAIMTLLSTYAGNGIVINESNVAGGITISSGTRGITETTTGQISLQTSDTTDGIIIGTTTSGIPITIGTANSSILLNGYTEISEYGSIGTTPDSNSGLYINRTYTGTGTLPSSQLKITGIITNSGSANNVYSQYINPASITNGSVSIVSSLALDRPSLTISSGSVANSSTLYIFGATTNATQNYAIYTAAGNIRFIGSTTGNYVNWDATSNTFSVLGNLSASGSTTFGAISASSIVTSGGVSVGGTLGVTGATTLSNILNVTGATTLASTLGVTGTSTLGTLSAGTTTLTSLSSGNTTITGTLGVSGATTLSNTLSVTGATTLASTLGVTGASTLGLLSSGNTSIIGTLSASGATTISNTLQVTGTSTLGTLSAGATTVTSLTNTGNETISGTLGVTGATTLGNSLTLSSASGNITVNTNKFSVTGSNGNTVIAGTLSAGATTVSSLTDSGNASITGTLSAGATTISSLTNTGNETISGTLGVTGATTLGNSLTLNSVSGNITVNTNKFLVTGSNGNTTIAGTLNVNGATTFASTLGVTGITTLGTLNANATSVTTLTSSSDVAIGGDLSVTGSISSSSLSIPTLSVSNSIAVNVNKFTVASNGNTAIAGTLSAGATTLNSTLGVTGATSLSSTLNVANDFSVNTNKFTIDGPTGNAFTAGTFEATGATTLDNTLQVTGATTLNSTLDVTGATTLDSTLDVANNLAINTNKFTVDGTTGNTAIAGTLGVAGNVSINTNKFTITGSNGNTAIAGTLGVTGNVSINTNKFTVTGSNGNTTIAGTLGVTGTSTLSTTICPSIASTTTTMVRQPYMPYDEIMVHFNGILATIISQTNYLANSYTVVPTINGTGDYTFTFTPVTPGTRTFGNAYLVGYASDVNPSVVASWTYATPAVKAAEALLFDSTGTAVDSTGIFVIRIINSNQNNTV